MREKSRLVNESSRIQRYFKSKKLLQRYQHLKRTSGDSVPKLFVEEGVKGSEEHWRGAGLANKTSKI